MHRTQEIGRAAMSADFSPAEADQSTQCGVVLAALRTGPQRTADIYGLGILAPARRILDLKRAGHCIDTLKVGRIGVYVLRDEVKP
jgi:hypothetical protein